MHFLEDQDVPVGNASEAKSHNVSFFLPLWPQNRIF